MGPAELGNYDCSPSPERALESENKCKPITCTSFQGNVHSIDVILEDKHTGLMIMIAHNVVKVITHA